MGLSADRAAHVGPVASPTLHFCTVYGAGGWTHNLTCSASTPVLSSLALFKILRQGLTKFFSLALSLLFSPGLASLESVFEHPRVSACMHMYMTAEGWC